jgi:hypothetical protein
MGFGHPSHTGNPNRMAITIILYYIYIIYTYPYENGLMTIPLFIGICMYMWYRPHVLAGATADAADSESTIPVLDLLEIDLRNPQTLLCDGI